MPSRPPFDPVRGAFLILMVLVIGLLANSGFLFVGCALLRVDAICQKSGSNLTTLGLEILTAVAILIGVRR